MSPDRAAEPDGPLVADAPPVEAATPDGGPNSAADVFATALGVRTVARTAGEVTLELVVAPGHLNAIGVAHGGALFALADAAIAAVANRPGDPAVTVSTHMQFLRAARPGDLLVAVAREDYRGGRLGAYRVDIRRGDELVATAAGEALRLSGGNGHERRRP